MNELQSKVLVSLEALVILAPLTLLTSFYLAFIAALYWETYDLVPWHGYFVPFLAIAALGCLLCLWKAVLTLTFQGRAGLDKIDRRLIISIYLGALLAVFGVACIMAVQWFEMPDIFQVFRIYAYGTPALVPAVHIAFERHISASNE
ncbi:MAG: hypothetical protein ACK4OE_09470 [Acidovorax sp.]|uniref:hypothetical protein n=1 Tax=Acidovorax sp. TaxID=1872122 RepID=UPI00391C6250